MSTKREDYKRPTDQSSFKRSNDYKREPEPPIRPSYEGRVASVVSKDPRYSDTSNYRSGNRDDRDTRDKSNQFYKHDNGTDKSNQYYGNGNSSSRYDSQSNMKDTRYQDRQTSSSGGGGSGWYSNSGSASGGQSQHSKSFMSSGGGGGGGQTSSSNSWPMKQQQPDWGRNMDSNQDRYDRTYNERRAPQYSDSQRPTSFIAGRPQDRGYGGGGGGRF